MVRQDRMQPPTDAMLRLRLGPSYPAYRALVDAYPELRPEWKWYGEKSGWSLKLLEGKRNLCFVSPGEERFTVAFVFNHAAVERALGSDLPLVVRHVIATAHTHAEGREFRIEVLSEAQLGPIHELIRIKRGTGRQSGAPRHSRKRAARHAPAPPAPGRGGAQRPGPNGRRGDRAAPSQRRGRSPGQ